MWYRSNLRPLDWRPGAQTLQSLWHPHVRCFLIYTSTKRNRASNEISLCLLPSVVYQFQPYRYIMIWYQYQGGERKKPAPQCMCVCVYQINRSGPNLIIIHLNKTKCGCRSGPWSAGQEGKRETKGAAPGYKLQKRVRKQFPQKAKSEISNLFDV